ncbi:hypothetical protein [Amaricoccus sp.]|uniref:hypothetical protein n=1 Tax=Amaricoccus sp. TaxID=1872485 RepID=UPI0026052935|nr:hypothetical protein [uncultured Amaricoccus sp.]
MRERPKPAVLIALTALGTALWNFPLLMVWDRESTILGLPALPVALFAIWAGLIAALAWVSERRK